MKNYVKPMVVANDSLAESVYMASGDCWTIQVSSDQAWNGQGHTFRVQLNHPTGLLHISAATTVTLTFSDNLTSGSSEGNTCTVNGNVMTIVRKSLGNAYNSGDSVNYLVCATAADQAATEALTITAKSVVCDRVENVQGGKDPGM